MNKLFLIQESPQTLEMFSYIRTICIRVNPNDMPQQEQERQSRVITRPSNREPRRYRVNVLNDDFTTFEFVIMVMMTVFNKTMTEAEDIAETTHIHQKASVGVYSLDIARSKVAKATEMARAENYPLRFEIQPE